jgi:6-phosphogluconolactonase
MGMNAHQEFAMTDTQQTCRWQVYATADALQADAVKLISEAAQSAISAHGEFHIVLAGGSTPRAVYESLAGIRTDWSAWHIYFGDERCLPSNDPERNSSMALHAWLRHVNIPHMQIYMIPAELGAIRAAQEYAKLLQGVGDFDLVLLGLGEDGHTASLFPGQEWGVDPSAPAALAVHDAPKPPPERVSLSAWRLSRARQVLFLVAGAGKRDAVKTWRAGGAIPARAIAPETGVEVLADSAAAGENG